MYKISSHPILNTPEESYIEFIFDGEKIKGIKGQSIAAALHQTGHVVHNHSLENRKRTLECGIGKCSACEMLVDGQIKRICITKVDDVKRVERLSAPSGESERATNAELMADFKKSAIPDSSKEYESKKVYKTTVAIIGAGPAGLAVREELNKAGVDNIVIDNNSHIGGQFLMQTHQFFFFEKEKRFGGMRGFDIANMLAGESSEGIMLDSVVWDIFENKRLAVKNMVTDEQFYIDCEELVIATGAVPFMPAFKNDDVPGVYTAAVVQRMMNTDFTLLGKKILTIGAGNIGYLTSYQAMQAGATVKAIVEAQPFEGGFPVQANRVRRLGIPIITGHTLLEAIPNEDHTGVIGAIIAKCENFKPIPGTEQRIDDIDCINICTGLIPDNQLLTKGDAVFGRRCHGVGDAIRIGEGTSAVLRGKQCAYEIMQSLGKRINYNEYLTVSKEYIDSQQHPERIRETPLLPSRERMDERGFVVLDCLYGFACNPCSFACKYGAITKSSTSTVPHIDYSKCIGCMECVYQCPGLAIFGYNLKRSQLYLPFEYFAEQGEDVYLIDNNGRKLGSGVIERTLLKPNKTNIAVVKATDLQDEELLNVRGFIIKGNYPKPLEISESHEKLDSKTYVCHCEDLTIDKLLTLIGSRKSITADELKHISRLGMGACRGKRCLPRAKSALRSYGIEIVGDFTPRGPMANLVEMGNLINRDCKEQIIIASNHPDKAERVGAIVAGGGMGGSALFRYLSEAGYKPVMINKGVGGSWRNIAGGRPAFSLPALADIANHNLDIFKDLSKRGDIDFNLTRYVNLAHDESTYKSLEASMEWSDAYMVDRKDFTKEISEYFNPDLKTYSHALITHNCWQASPGKSIDLIRQIGEEHGGTIVENSEVVNVTKNGNIYNVIILDANGKYKEYQSEIFINALGSNAGDIARSLGIETGLFPVRHQAFITKRLPMLGKDGAHLSMIIDRRKYKGFSAVYGQQLAETGQIIGCASPLNDASDSYRNQSLNTQDFMEIVSETFGDWIPKLKGVGFQAIWAGYYVEPRYIIDPKLGLFIGMRGHGFMLSQYIAKLYVDVLQGKEVPGYFHELALDKPGLSETAFK